MKNQLVVLALFLLSVTNPVFTVAQSNDEPQTLFQKGEPINTENLGVFVAPSFGFTQMDGAGANLFNLRAGVSIKDQISFGAYFSTSMNDMVPQSETVPNVYMDYWTVGGFAEYTWNASKLVHLTFPLYIGYGEVQMDNEIGEAGLGEANFFQVEPSALIEINLHRLVSLNAGAGYRIVGNMEYRNFNQSDLSGLSGYIGLKFNIF
ncbi:hypothetical protein [uncultured Algoriphagus sp.]|uniref:hypothetical protein n=1 Tax=uncultured Algoriphagus sp. TaxID=417365 RepID=UPI00259463F8|nr:hypothetical protein [uncultured Algoriphagus sp.]